MNQYRTEKMRGWMAEDTKTQKVIALLAAGISKPQIMVQAGCSQNYVYRVLKKFEVEIARLKAAAQPGVEPACPAPKSKVLDIPKLDPAQPAAVQLEGMAWGIIAQAAAGGDVSVKQASAAREIIKAALRDKVPPPVNRKLIFKLDVIDIVGDSFSPISQTIYEVKP